MAASLLPRRLARPVGARRTRALPTTLLELVDTVSELARNDEEVVAAVLDLLESGRVRLCGTFRDRPPHR
jgi:hypothetical protein